MFHRIKLQIAEANFFDSFLSIQQSESNTYGFELPSKQACKHLYSCCREHQAFFKLTQGGDENLGPLAGFTSRFRFNGDNNSVRKSITLRSNNTLHDRPPSAVVRVPSRRYQRRSNQVDVYDGMLN